MKYKVILLVLFVIGFFVGVQPAAADSKTLYKRILETGGLFDKKDIGTSLGKKGRESETYILQLLNNDHYWNRYAGIAAAAEYSSPTVNTRLAELLIADHMVSEEIKTLMNSKPKRFEETIVRLWKKDLKIDSKRKLLEVMIDPGSSKITEVLKAEISAKSSGLRKDAYAALASGSAKQEDGFLRSFLEDSSLRPQVLQYIYKNGSASDKAYMLGVLEDDLSSAEEKITALYCIKKWGSFGERKKELVRALKSARNGSSVMIHAIYLFGEIRSPEIRTELCRHSQSGSTQELRVSAAESLIPYQEPVNRICLKRISEEMYESQSSRITAGDVIAGIVTLGLTGIVNMIKENQTREAFLSRQTRIKEHIELLELMAKEKE